ncbi:L-threonylcarbamoyladenylate synthase [Methylovirgula sp. 4M-Z18]|uniref:L-threonylcarbamoyladenylate synthase n=1 Tax=Methylovirgula sp. 4M-Z18 TaxID=2293567 RepID=UPI000E2FCFD9|nr:L-threonylcarbamoyladenylate synthase [Methylovirgula sp. 4M-Z18]RFB80130.1 threonylcarbamoyl-AMP synthase [Methylovirgula sp. 4M-Z18]
MNIPSATKTHLLAADPAAIARAAQVIRAGGLVSFPTETVYGLGADASSDQAVAGIYAAKERPTFNPLIAHVPDLAAAQRQGVFDGAALWLAQAFWPGPLTLVVPLAGTATVSSLARAGLASVALRVPRHPVAQELLRAVDRPVAAPSANRSGRISPSSAQHVFADLAGRIDLVLDAGPTEVGVESTIVSCLDPHPVLLRPGGVTRAQIEAVLRAPLTHVSTGCADDQVAPVAPGQLVSHYAPRAAVRLGVLQPRPDDAVLDFAGQLAGHQGPYLDLSPAGDLMEGAAHLFAYLHRLDAAGAPTIAVAPIPMTDLGEAINDRLARAAAPRI